MDAPIPRVGDIWEKIYTTPALWHFHFVKSPIALELVKEGITDIYRANDEARKRRTPVLIVGAGPTGLMMASQLARFGIPFRLIEKNEGPTTQSRALVIQPRSLEIFEQMGIAERAVKQGKIFQTINY